LSTANVSLATNGQPRDRATVLQRAAKKWSHYGDEEPAHAADATKGAYVAALRAARRDVDKLRGAQHAAALVIERDERRTTRAWRKWAGCWQAWGAVLTAKRSAAAKLSAMCKRHELRKLAARLHRLRSTCLVAHRAARRAAGAALLLAALRRRRRAAQRGAMRVWRDSVERAKRAAHAHAVAASRFRKAARGRMQTGFAAWRDSTRREDERKRDRDNNRRRGAERLLRRSRGGAERLAFARWRASIQQQGALMATQKCRRGAAQWLQRTLRCKAHSSVQGAYTKWKATTTAARALNRLALERGVFASARRESVAKSRVMAGWRHKTLAAVAKKQMRHKLFRVVRRLARSQQHAALSTWRSFCVGHSNACAVLHRLGASDAKRKSPLRLALKTWRDALKASAVTQRVFRKLRDLLRASKDSDAFHVGRLFRRWQTAAKDLKQKAKAKGILVLLGAMGAATANRARVVGAAFHLWNARGRVLYDGRALCKRVALRMLHRGVHAAWAAWRARVREIGRSDAAKKQMRRVGLLLVHGSVAKVFFLWRMTTRELAGADAAVAKIRRVALRLQHAQLISGWQKWRSADLADVKLESRQLTTRRVLARMIKAELLGCWRQWRRGDAAEALRRRAMKRAVTVMLSKQLSAAWRRWRFHDARRSDSVDLLRRCALRMHSVALCGAWVRWLEVCEAAKALDGVKRKAVLKMVKVKLSSAWACWKAQQAFTARVEAARGEVKRTVLRMLRQQLSSAWRQWSKRHAERRLVSYEAAQNAAAKLGLLGMFARRCGGNAAARLLQAWVQWTKVLQGRELTKAKLRGSILRMLKRHLSAGWVAWRADVKRCTLVLGQRKAMKRTVLGMQKAELAAAWRRWKAVDSKQRKVKRRVTRVLRRVLYRALFAAWRCWRLGDAAVLHRRQVMVRTVKRMLRAQLAAAFSVLLHNGLDRDVTVAVMTRTILRFANAKVSDAWNKWKLCASQQFVALKCLRVVRHAKLSAALRTWKASSKAHAALQKRLLCTRRVLGRMRSKQLAAALRQWRNAHAQMASKRAVVLRCVGRMKKLNLARGWAAWRRADAVLVHQIAVAKKAAVRMYHAFLSAAWAAWRLNVKAKRKQAQLLRRVVGRVLSKRLFTAWRQWRVSADGAGAQRELLAKVSRRMLRVQLYLPFRRWRAVNAFDKLLDARRKTVKRVFVKMAKMELASGWRQLVAGCISRDAGKVVMRRAAARMLHCKLSAALHAWRSKAATQTTLRRCAAHLVKHRVATAWRSWVGNCRAAALRTIAKSRVQRILLRLLKKELSDGWRQWLSAHASLLKKRGKMTKVLARMCRGRLYSAVAKWKSQVRAFSARARLLRQATARLLHAKLGAGWAQWRLGVAQALDDDARMVRVLKRACKMALWSPWAHWRAQDRFAKRALNAHKAMRKVALRLSMRELAKALRQWRRSVSSLQIAKRAAKAVCNLSLRITKAGLARAWRAWYETCIHQGRTLDATAARAAARRVSLVGVLAARCGNRARAAQSQAFLKWRDGARFLRRCEARRGQAARSAGRICRRLRLGDAHRALNKWRAFSADAKRRFALFGRGALVASVTVRRMAHRRAAKAFATFLHNTLIVHASSERRLRGATTARRIMQRLVDREAVSTRRSAFGRLKNAALERHGRVSASLRRLAAGCDHAAASHKLRCLSRAWRRWQAQAVRLRRLFDVAAPKLWRTAMGCVLRRAFSKWERFAIDVACNELSSRRAAEAQLSFEVTEPSRVAFAKWRANSAADARCELYAAAALVDARQDDMRYAAICGAIAVAFAVGPGLHAIDASPRAKATAAFRKWRADTRHRRGAKLLHLVLGAARDALRAVAFDHWASAVRRSRQVETRLWKKVQHRVLLRAWLHWWTQVEVVRELQSLQRGVRALVRVRGSHANA